MSDNATVDDILPKYGRLQESVSSLVNLARVNPHVLEDVIKLAMMMGIHEAHAREAREAAFSDRYFDPGRLMRELHAIHRSAR